MGKGNIDITVTTQKKMYITILNICACFGVVVLHSNKIFWTFPKGSTWVTANFLETFFYWPVPVFFMITGATLLDYRQKYSTKIYFVKRIRKTVIPFIVWSIIAALINIFYAPQGNSNDILMIVNNIVNTTYLDSVYWFFFPLFSVYLSIPIFSALTEKIRILSYAVVCGFIFVSVLPFVNAFLKIPYNAALTPPAVSGYMIYVFLGYLISKCEISKKQRVLIYILGILGWLSHFCGTIVLSDGKEIIDTTFKGYTNWPGVLQAVAIFVFFKYKNYDSKLLNSKLFLCTIKKFADVTFGVYLVHYYFVMILYR